MRSLTFGSVLRINQSLLEGKSPQEKYAVANAEALRFTNENGTPAISAWINRSTIDTVDKLLKDKELPDFQAVKAEAEELLKNTHDGDLEKASFFVISNDSPDSFMGQIYRHLQQNNPVGAYVWMKASEFAARLTKRATDYKDSGSVN